MNYQALPKVVLHDHLDGGIRPITIIDLAKELGYTKLPSADPQEIATWFAAGANKKNLVEYLTGFQHTVHLMQTAEAIERVTHESVVDAAADGAVYFETRYAPEQHCTKGLSYQDVIAAVDRGLISGMEEVADDERTIEAFSVICALRHEDSAVRAARSAVEGRDAGYRVVGFDIAGPEAGFPPERLKEAFDIIRQGNLRTTIHAGEAAGLESMEAAMNICGAERFGHGVRITEDFTIDGDIVDLGLVSQMILDRGIALECCPSSNVHTGAVPSIEEHPIDMLLDLGFAVTVNPDNRLMSGVTMTSEFELLHEVFGWDLEEFEAVTLNAIDAAFASFQIRDVLTTDYILEGYNQAKMERDS